MKFTLIAQPLLAAAVLAVPSYVVKRDLATIQGAIGNVQKSLDALGTAVNVSSPLYLYSISPAMACLFKRTRILTSTFQAVSASDPNTLQGVLTASTDAQNVIKQSTTTIQGTDTLSLTDALSLQQTATGLTTSANKTITTLVQKKPIFDQLGVSAVVGQNLQAQKTAAGGLGDAIVSKVPAIGQSIAQQSIGQINTIIDGGIKAYAAAPAAGTAATGATGAGASNSTGTATGAAPKTSGAGKAGAGTGTGATEPAGAAAAEPAAAPKATTAASTGTESGASTAAAPATGGAGGLTDLLSGLTGGAGGAGGLLGAL